MPLPRAQLERLRPVLERIVARLQPEEIWLFGSRAENRARPESDYDLLAVLPDGTPEAELDPIQAWSIVRGLGVPVDLVPCTRSDFEEEKYEIDTLARAAFLRGIRLYERIGAAPDMAKTSADADAIQVLIDEARVSLQ